MTREIADIILGFSPPEMEMYLSIGGFVPLGLERDWLRRQRIKSVIVAIEVAQAVAVVDLGYRARVERYLCEAAA